MSEQLVVAPRRNRDPWAGRTVFVAAARAGRPTAPTPSCPFCAGGTEAPEPFTTPYAFVNRWPAVAPESCEVVVHGDDHRDFATMPVDRVRDVVDLWAARSTSIGARPGVACVLVFENRGRDAGATVDHPHSQVFGLPLRPSSWPAVEDVDRCPGCVDAEPALTLVVMTHWRTEFAVAPAAPYDIRIVARRHVGELADLGIAERTELAHAIRAAVRVLDDAVGGMMPYHLWVQHGGHLAVHLVGLLRSPGVPVVLGAAETATGFRFTPVDPHAAAADLRALVRRP